MSESAAKRRSAVVWLVLYEPDPEGAKTLRITPSEDCANAEIGAREARPSATTAARMTEVYSMVA